MKLPYGYVLDGEEIAIHEEKADVVRSIFEYYLAGASLGKIVDMLFAKGIPSPTGNLKWTRAGVDKLLANKKYVPIVGVKVYLDAQFEKNRRCNVIMTRPGTRERRLDISLRLLKRNKTIQIPLFLVYLRKGEWDSDSGRNQQLLYTFGIPI